MRECIYIYIHMYVFHTWPVMEPVTYSQSIAYWLHHKNSFVLLGMQAVDQTNKYINTTMELATRMNLLICCILYSLAIVVAIAVFFYTGLCCRFISVVFLSHVTSLFETSLPMRQLQTLHVCVW